MYNWYRNAWECLVYLEDTSKLSGGINTISSGGFEESAWFTRGWTLQELLAPRRVIYYDYEWELLGHQRRMDGSNPGSLELVGPNLLEVVSKITSIPKAYMTGAKSLQQATIAQRMSWAANRKTTRAEDEAYSLLGIFGINMPLLYGEGRDAFTRLQEEIIKRTADQSILAWDPVRPNFDWHGVLAESPEVFKQPDDTVERAHLFRKPYISTSNGIEMRVNLYEGDRSGYDRLSHAFLYKIPLNYSNTNKGRDPVYIYLKPDSERNEPRSVFQRVTGPVSSLESRRWKHLGEHVIRLQARPDIVREPH